MKTTAAMRLARRRNLDAAERSGIREGLPPVSDFARAIGNQYVEGQLTADEAVAAIVQHCKKSIAQQ